jgi:hypothetical protein
MRIIALLLCCLDAAPGFPPGRRWQAAVTPTMPCPRPRRIASPQAAHPDSRNPGLAASSNWPRPERDRWRQAALTRLRSVALEEGDDSEDAAVVVVGLGQVQLGEDGADVFLHGAFGDSQPPGDAGVGASFGHQREHLAFPGAEHGQRINAAAGCHQLLDHGRIHHRAAPGDPLQRADPASRASSPSSARRAGWRSSGRRCATASRPSRAPPPLRQSVVT